MAAAASSVPSLQSLCLTSLVKSWHAAVDLSRAPASVAAAIHERLHAHLVANECPLTAAALYPFVASCWQLHDLDLTDCRIWVNDEALSALAYITSLRSFTLKGAERVTDSSLAFASRQRHLTSLDVSFCSALGDASAAQYIARLGPGLRSLNLSGTRLTDAGVAPLLSLTGLRHLGLGSTQITDVALEYITYYGRYPAQAAAAQPAAGAQPAGGAARATQGFPELEWLSLAGTHITDTGLGKLCAVQGGVVFKGLKLLVLSMTAGVTPRAVAEVRNKYRFIAPLPNAQRTLASSNLDAMRGEAWFTRISPSEPGKGAARSAKALDRSISQGETWVERGLKQYIKLYGAEVAAQRAGLPTGGAPPPGFRSQAQPPTTWPRPGEKRPR